MTTRYCYECNEVAIAEVRLRPEDDFLTPVCLDHDPGFGEVMTYV